MIRRNHVAFAIASLAPIIFHANTVAAQEGIWSFGVLGASTVTNTGDSVITGNVGVSPGGAIVGFPPGIVIPPYTFHANDAVASEARPSWSSPTTHCRPTRRLRTSQARISAVSRWVRASMNLTARPI